MRAAPRLPRPDGAKPRVLLVDDHRAILDRVSAMLVHDFEVVGTATGGTQALDMASRLAPDAIVLDINMPGLDGFDTRRALEHAGSRAPVVFLSASKGDDHVRDAFNCGGRGYVLKSHLARDLVAALDQVLLGRVFAPSLASLFDLAHGGEHAIQFHDDIESFLDGLATVFDLALRRGDATCIITTAEVRDGLGRRLRAAGWDVGGPSGDPRYLVVDAAEALRRMMRNGLPDARILGDMASELDQYRGEVAKGPQSRLTLYGDMVVPLIAGGNPAAAIALESEWTRLTGGLPFFTVCGYHASCLEHSVPDVWGNACAEHWAVSHCT